MKKFISFLLVFAMLSTTSSTVFAANTVYLESLSNAGYAFDSNDLEQLEHALNIIMETPDEFLVNASTAEIRQYFLSKGIDFKTYDQLTLESDSYSTQGFWDATKCAAAIALLIGGTVFVGAKLVKVKNYVKAIGGVKNAASALIAFSKAGSKIPDNVKKDVGEAIMGLASEILGIADVQDYCFGG
jgi:hypothetical protein